MPRWKNLSEFQMDDKLTLRLNCSYSAFVEWLKNYPESKGVDNHQTIKLKFSELPCLNIWWIQTLSSPDHSPFEMVLFDQFVFDVIENSPLVLSGYYSCLQFEKSCEIYSGQARDFLELANRYFGGNESNHLKRIEVNDPDNAFNIPGWTLESIIDAIDAYNLDFGDRVTGSRVQSGKAVGWYFWLDGGAIGKVVIAPNESPAGYSYRISYLANTQSGAGIYDINMVPGIKLFYEIENDLEMHLFEYRGIQKRPAIRPAKTRLWKDKKANIETTELQSPNKGGAPSKPGYDAAFKYYLEGHDLDETFSYWRKSFPDDAFGDYANCRKKLGKAIKYREETQNP